MVDIDYEKVSLFVGNYDFWLKSSELIQKQMRDSNKKKEVKIKELEDFIRRFSANASKSKQATSRKKALEKIKLDEIKPSSRRYPFIEFTPSRYLGKDVIRINKLNYEVDGKVLIKNLKLTIDATDKIALIGNNEQAKTAFLELIYNNNSNIIYGKTVSLSYYPKDNSKYFNKKISMVKWLEQYSDDTDETFIRGFLGRMLFSGEEALKNVDVLSGGEKVRLMLSKMMLEKSNILLFDEPTNHLDMESITSLNKALTNFNGVIIISTFDRELIDTVCNRVIKINDDGTIIDFKSNYSDYIKKYGNIES